jgi:hypothetical protein
MKNVRYEVKSSAYSIDFDIFSTYQNLLLKADKTPEESCFLNRMEDLVQIYNKQSKKVAYLDSSQFLSVDVGLVVDRPEPLFMREAECSNDIISASFSIPVEAYESGYEDSHEFVDWYISHYASLFKRIVAKHFSFRVIQPHNVRPEWSMNDKKLSVNFKYKVIFK